LENIYHWKESIGPLYNRKPDRNIWGYHQTRGLGFYEYFQFCEDIGAEPLPVLAAGVPCQNSAANAEGIAGQQGGIPMNEMPAYVQDVLDLIEWANGDAATSKWAKMRADAGHPAPFQLKMIGIGNEDLITTQFEERYLMICKAVKAKYPNIEVVGTVGPFHYPSADYIEGWKFAKAHKEVIDAVDEHYYESTGWFLHNQDYYDSYDRKAPKVYLGEYASRTRTMESALAEAVHLCNIERNGDVVEMTSYAPLLCHEKHQNWNPDMIYFKASEVKTTPSYNTQALFSQFSGDSYVASRVEIAPELAYRMAASVVKDSRSGNTYLKLVNALPVTVSLKVDGLALPAQPRMVYFSGKPGDESSQLRSSEESGALISVQNGRLQLPAYSVVTVSIAP
ncbi:MAG: alpha-L-arabinofuranosidase C-terminal domain-containing protein, partial [Segatella oris]